MGSFNWIDALGIIVLLRLTYVGVRLGLGTELTKLLGVLVGVFVGFRWYQVLGDWLATRTVLSHERAGALVLAALVVASYLIVGLGLRALGKLATVRFTPTLGKVGGGAAAIARSGLVMSIFLVILQQFPSEYLHSSIEERSWSGRYLARVAPAVYDAVTPRLTRCLSITRPAS